MKTKFNTWDVFCSVHITRHHIQITWNTEPLSQQCGILLLLIGWRTYDNGMNYIWKWILYDFKICDSEIQGSEYITLLLRLEITLIVK